MHGRARRLAQITRFEMATDGASVVARALKDQGVAVVFGVVGIPIVELAMAIQDAGIQFIGTRNEQAASYAASVVGYLTKRPAGVLVVPGPGLIHALPGVANATVNCWPMVVIAGGFDQDQTSMGGFQEWPQVESSRIYVKYAVRLYSIESIPFHVEKAVRSSMYGRPGPSYIEVPGNMVTDSVEDGAIVYLPRCPDPPMTLAEDRAIKSAVSMLKEAKCPLVIIGKGAAYSGAEAEIQYLVTRNSLPFLPTPMGKGVISDDHPLCVAPARSRALNSADVILLLGARLNWILHFGKEPRFKKDVKIIQVDILPEEMSNNVQAAAMLCGDIKAVVAQLNKAIIDGKTSRLCDLTGDWMKSLRTKIAENTAVNRRLAEDTSSPMNFYAAYAVINKVLPRNAIIVNEGSSTMDIGRTALPNHFPKHRLDAGTFGAMGLGAGYAIAASLLEKMKPHKERCSVFCIQGDSAFGFAGMEFETACRYELPIFFIVMNNNGIYSGLDHESWSNLYRTENQLGLSLPPTSLLPGISYEKLAAVFGAKGYQATSVKELKNCLVEMLNYSGSLPQLLNVEILPSSLRKPQEFSWLTKAKL